MSACRRLAGGAFRNSRTEERGRLNCDAVSVEDLVKLTESSGARMTLQRLPKTR